MTGTPEASVHDDAADRAWWKALEPVLGARLMGWTFRGRATFVTPSEQTVTINGEIATALQAALLAAGPPAPSPPADTAARREALIEAVTSAIGEWMSHTPGLRPPLHSVLATAIRAQEAAWLHEAVTAAGAPDDRPTERPSDAAAKALDCVWVPCSPALVRATNACGYLPRRDAVNPRRSHDHLVPEWLARDLAAWVANTEPAPVGDPSTEETPEETPEETLARHLAEIREAERG